jgi:uncharacterized membrane-anchored protein
MALLVSTAASAQQLDPPQPQMHPKKGPQTLDLGNALSIDLPEGYAFLDATDAKVVMEHEGNEPDPEMVGLLVKQGEDWFAIVRYEPAGYVKDDEAAKLDADAILTSIREGTEAANRYRQEHGFQPIQVVGWSEPPRYDGVSHQLTWAVEGKGKGSVVNFNTRILGRKGYASINLISVPTALAQDRASVAPLLAATHFQPGARYEDFTPGKDKVAEYGLAALVAGGAGAVALKLVKVGLIAKFWNVILGFLIAAKKLIIALVVGGMAAIRRLFGRKKAEPAAPPAQPPPAG